MMAGGLIYWGVKPAYLFRYNSCCSEQLIVGVYCYALPGDVRKLISGFRVTDGSLYQKGVGL